MRGIPDGCNHTWFFVRSSGDMSQKPPTMRHIFICPYCEERKVIEEKDYFDLKN